WIATDLWQQVKSDGDYFQTTGRFLSAPGHRFHLEMHIESAESRCFSQQVCDGKMLWHVTKFGDHPTNIARVKFKKVLKVLNDSSTDPKVPEEFFQNQFFLGPLGLVKQVRKRTVPVGVEKGQCHGKDAHLVKLAIVPRPEKPKSERKRVSSHF